MSSLVATSSTSNSASSLPSQRGKFQSHCSYCKRDISNLCKITCVECSSYESCTDCFAAGAVLRPHLVTHSYKISDCLDFPVFTKDWTAKEELLMLEGVEKFGAGNAKAISEYISSITGSNKSTKQVEDRYWELYMGTHGYCLPLKALSSEGILTDISAILSADCQSIEDIFVDIKSQRNDPSILLYNRGDEVVRERAKDSSKANDVRERNALLPGGDLVGFMPLREDFDIEFDNDAEVILANMEFDPDEDHPSEQALKLQVVRNYNWKLDERNERKRFVIDRGYVDIKRQQGFEKRLMKEERELVARVRVFSRLQTAEEHEALVDGLLKAKKLRSHIELLQLYRKLGIRTVDEIRRYEADRKKKESDSRLKRVSMDSGDMPSRTASNGSLSGPRRRARYGESSVDDDADLNLKGTASNSDSVSVGVQHMPGAQLLSPLEVEFCSKIGMFPMHFLAVKEVIVREAFRNGRLTEEGMGRIFQPEYDAKKKEQIFDFFVKNVGINDADKKAALYITPRYFVDQKPTSHTRVTAEPFTEAEGTEEGTGDDKRVKVPKKKAKMS